MGRVTPIRPAQPQIPRSGVSRISSMPFVEVLVRNAYKEKHRRTEREGENSVSRSSAAAPGQ